MSFNLQFLIQILCAVVICGKQNVTKPSEEQNVKDTTGQQNVSSREVFKINKSINNTNKLNFRQN